MSLSRPSYIILELFPWFIAYAVYPVYIFYIFIIRILFAWCQDNSIVKKCVIVPQKFFEWIAKLGLSAPTGLLLRSKQTREVYINNKVVPNSILQIFGNYMFFCGLIIFSAFLEHSFG